MPPDLQSQSEHWNRALLLKPTEPTSRPNARMLAHANEKPQAPHWIRTHNPAFIRPTQTHTQTNKHADTRARNASDALRSKCKLHRYIVFRWHVIIMVLCVCLCVCVCTSGPRRQYTTKPTKSTTKARRQCVWFGMLVMLSSQHRRLQTCRGLGPRALLLQQRTYAHMFGCCFRALT